jgi:hypothetical protein
MMPATNPKMSLIATTAASTSTAIATTRRSIEGLAKSS